MRNRNREVVNLIFIAKSTEINFSRQAYNMTSTRSILVVQKKWIFKLCFDLYGFVPTNISDGAPCVQHA